MSEALFLMIIAIFGVAVGIAIGILIAYLRPTKPGGSGTPTTGPANMVEIAKIWQDKKSGQPYPEVNGKIVRFPADLSPGQRERLAGVFSLLLGWLSPSSASSSLESVERSAPPLVAVAAPRDTDLYTAPASANPPPRISPVDVVSRAIQSEVRLPSALEKSIVMQIDDILQEKLAGTELANKGIRLVELPSKDLVVMVGLNQYDGIDAVPDPQIKSLIRESVAEWEKTSAEG